MICKGVRLPAVVEAEESVGEGERVGRDAELGSWWERWVCGERGGDCRVREGGLLLAL